MKFDEDTVCDRCGDNDDLQEKCWIGVDGDVVEWLGEYFCGGCYQEVGVCARSDYETNCEDMDYDEVCSDSDCLICSPKGPLWTQVQNKEAIATYYKSSGEDTRLRSGTYRARVRKASNKQTASGQELHLIWEVADSSTRNGKFLTSSVVTKFDSRPESNSVLPQLLRQDEGLDPASYVGLTCFLTTTEWQDGPYYYPLHVHEAYHVSYPTPLTHGT